MQKQSGLLIINTGTPDSYSTKDVGKFLYEFLTDPRVITLASPWRELVVRTIIVPFRSPRSAHKYRAIWTAEGSPLLVNAKALAQSLEKQMSIPVEVGMRYGNPSVRAGIEALLSRGADHIVALPLFPHYAMSSYETAVECFKREARSLGVSHAVVAPYYNHPAYLSVMNEHILSHLKPDEKLLISFHGIPLAHVDKYRGDEERDYLFQCEEQHRLFLEQTGIPASQVEVTYQSRLGHTRWLSPYTAERLRRLPAEGVKKVSVVCPSFVQDCLETIEEMEVEGKEIFLSSGGESFRLIPCLNRRTDYLQEIIHPYI
ncbi:MAG: ferrochelatase [Porphyromonas sp.]|nr:ferrochelatase [Porphyromonas sp.]